MQEAGEWKPAIAKATLRTRTCAGVLARSRIAVLRSKFAGGNVRLAVCDLQHNRPGREHRRGGRRGNRQLRLFVRPSRRDGFVGPDEPRYVWIARAMAETGDWVTPRSTDSRGSKSRFSTIGPPRSDSACICRRNGPRDCRPRSRPSPRQLRSAWLGWKHYGGPAKSWSRASGASGSAPFSPRASPPSVLPARPLPTCFSARVHSAMASAAASCVTAVTLRAQAIRIKRPRRAPTRLRAARLFGAFLGSRSSPRDRRGNSRWPADIAFWALATRNWRAAFRPRASGGDRGVLRGRAPVVRALRLAQSRFPARLHLAAQFRALPHAGVPPQAAFLVLRPDLASGAASLDRLVLAAAGRPSALARKIVDDLSRILFRLLGRLSRSCSSAFRSPNCPVTFFPSVPAARADHEVGAVRACESNAAHARYMPPARRYVCSSGIFSSLATMRHGSAQLGSRIQCISHRSDRLCWQSSVVIALGFAAARQRFRRRGGRLLPEHARISRSCKYRDFAGARSISRRGPTRKCSDDLHPDRIFTYK